MKKFPLLFAFLLAGCYANPNESAQLKGHEKHIPVSEPSLSRQVKNNENADDINARFQGEHFRLEAIKLQGRDGNPFIVSVGKGYTKALVKDEPAKIVKKNPNWYEITTKEYIIGIYLDNNGFMSASWNRHHGRDHGDFVIIKDAE